MRGHDSSIHNISVHASGRYALTSSNSVAQLWDLDTFSRKRTLNGAQTVGIQQVWIYANSLFYKQLLGKEVFDRQFNNIFPCCYLVSGVLLRVGYWTNWPVARMMLPALFDHVAESFLIQKSSSDSFAYW